MPSFIRAGRVVGALDRLLQHDGHGDDDEQPGRGARHVAARLGGDPGALSRPAGMRLPHRQADRRDGARGPQAVGHPDARRVPSTRSRSTRRSAARPTRRSTSPPSPATSGVELPLDDWEEHGHEVPLLVNLQPAGEYLGEDYYRAGGVPAVVGAADGQGPDPRGRDDRQRQDHRRQLPRRARSRTSAVIRPFDEPLKHERRLHRAAAATCSTPRS